MAVRDHKNKYLSLGTSIMAPAIVMLVRGQLIEGTILWAMAIGFIGAYAYFDDKQKGAPSLPEGIDKQTLEELAEVSAEEIKDLRQR